MIANAGLHNPAVEANWDLSSRERERGGRSWRGSNQRNREHCAQFRRLDETTRTIKLIDTLGNTEVLQQRGHLPLTQHGTVLDILTQRSKRWAKQSPRSEFKPALRPTVGQVREEEEATRRMNGDILKVHGNPPGKKPEGVCRLVYENVNGISNRISCNSKLFRMRELYDSLEVELLP